MTRDDRKQRARGTFGSTPPLLPVAHRRDVEPEHAREAGLGEAQPPADRFNVHLLGRLILSHREVDLAAGPGDGFREALDQRLTNGGLAALLGGYCSASHG